MTAEDRSVRGNAIKPAEVTVSDRLEAEEGAEIVGIEPASDFDHTISETEPSDPVTDEIWFQPDEEADELVTRVWTGSAWIPALVRIIDDFEDGDIAEYTGDTGSFNVQQTTVKEGNYALEGSSDGTGSFEIASTTGLDRYAEAGDSFSYWSQTSRTDSGGVEIYFGYQDGNNYYKTGLRPAGDDFRLMSFDSGTGSVLASTAHSYTADVWREISIDWGTDGTIAVDLLDDSGTVLESISATDETFTTGGIAWAVSNGTNSHTGRFDLAKIE